MLSSFRTFGRDFAHGSAALGVRAGVLTLAGALLEGVGLLLLLPLVNVIADTRSGNGVVDAVASRVVAALPGDSVAARLIVLLGAFALLMVLRGFVIVHRDVSLAKLQTGFVHNLRLRIVQTLARADWSVLTQLRHGRVSHVLSNDIRGCGLAAQLTLQSVVAGTLLAVQMALALLLSPPIAGLVVVLLAFGALLLRPALRRSRELGAQLTDTAFRLTDDTGQFLGGLKLAFSQNLQDRFVGEFGRTVAAGAEREVAFARQRSRAQVALTSLAAAVAGLALILGFAVFETSPTSLIALLVVLARMSGPAAQLQQNLQYIAHSLPAYEKIRGLEADLSAYRRDGLERVSATAPPLHGDIVLQAACYRHGTDLAGGAAPGVGPVDLAIGQGEFLGISGSSGAGKTTLVDLIVGLLPPQSGTVSIGGSVLTKDTLRAWRDRVSYVAQDPFLFNETVAENLRWARPDAQVEDVWRALELAGAADMIRALPAGLETVVGERGALLSGGERQRIALARALIREPLLLVLDEATNAIDVEGERAILQRLLALDPRPAIVMVAHRDQSLAMCERIVTLNAGHIVEDVRPRTLSAARVKA
ncbi:MAG TPA: ABC transporter ATP-binding protein [Sphingomonadaceae bacterium]|nr:ABC transporter ATP-binding protein [Sphingomonadaceae bacterium]